MCFVQIKSGNILITGNGEIKVVLFTSFLSFLSFTPKAKVGDFGFATKVEAPATVETKQRAKTVLGTPLWMAPEIHRREQYSSAVDIWAIGIVALEMAEVWLFLLSLNL